MYCRQISPRSKCLVVRGECGGKSKTPRERLNYECVIPTVKHGCGFILEWVCFRKERAGNLNGSKKKEQYNLIWQGHAILSEIRLIGINSLLNKTKDLKHFSELCKN